MANHARNQIRDLVFARLAGLSTSGARLYKSRVFQMNDNTIPGLILYTTHETVEHRSVGANRLTRRELTVVIEAYAKTSAGTENTLDAMCKEVETALAADTSLGGKVVDIYLDDTDIKLDDADCAIGVATLIWLVHYNVRESTPDQLLN